MGGLRLKTQFAEKGITADEQYPLFVYLPCGCRWYPGGVVSGLKLAFGDAGTLFLLGTEHIHPVMCSGHTGLHDAISVQEIGIDNITARWSRGRHPGRSAGHGAADRRLLHSLMMREMYNLLGLLIRLAIRLNLPF